MPVLLEFNSSGSHPLKVLNKLFNNVGRFDITLVTKNKRILAHKLILSANSDYFNDLFIVNPDLKEVPFPEINGDVLEQCVKFCYSGQIVFTHENIIDLVIVSQQLAFNTIEKEGLKLLTHNVKSDKLIKSILTIDSQKITKESALNNVPEITNIVSKELVVCIAKQAKKLNLLNDIEMLEFFKIWIEKNPKERQKSASYFLTCFNLKKVSMEFLWKHVRHICKDSASTKLFEEAMDFQVCSVENKKATETIKPPVETKIIKPTELVSKFAADICIWLRVRIHEDQFLINYCPRENSFTKLNNIKNSIGYKNIRLDNKIFHVVAGKIKFYDIDSKEWGDLVKLDEGIVYCCSFESHLYAVSTSLTIFKYNFNNSSWKQFGTTWPYCIINEIGSAFITFNNKLYVVGGNNFLLSMKSFDLKTGNWEIITKQLINRSCLRLAACDGNIYAFSGSITCADKGPLSKMVQKYDPLAKQWTTLPVWSLPELPLYVTVVQDQIFVITENYDLVSYNTKDHKIEKLTNLRQRLEVNNANFIYL